MEPLWVALRESIYLINFRPLKIINNKVQSLLFKVYCAYQKSAEGGVPPYRWLISGRDNFLIELKDHECAPSIMSGIIDTTGKVDWKLEGGHVRGFNPQHPREIFHILTTVYWAGSRFLPFTGLDLTLLPKEAEIISPSS